MTTRSNTQSDLVSEPSKPVSSESTEPQTETEGNDEEEAEPVSAVEDENPRQVSREEAEAYAKEANLLFFEASAKVSHGFQTRCSHFIVGSLIVGSLIVVPLRLYCRVFILSPLCLANLV